MALMTQDLTQLREQIDQIDANLLALLDKRMKLAIEIAETKKFLGKLVLDTSREAELFEKLKKQNSETILPDEKVLEIWGKIIELSRTIQEKRFN